MILAGIHELSDRIETSNKNQETRWFQPSEGQIVPTAQDVT